MNDFLYPLPRRSLRETAAEVIGRYIAEAGLIPGGSLPTERAMSKGLAVSRTVVREALAMLETEGLVERRQSVGYFVTSEAGNLHINRS